ncbi:MAG: DNA-binding protein [Bryobacterales bacterium]|nr:DNA-binding protein [Bryobacterales bacterium]
MTELDKLAEVLTIADVARLLRCSKAHVCKIINGQVKGAAPIPTIAVGRRKIVRRQSLLRWFYSALSEPNRKFLLPAE